MRSPALSVMVGNVSVCIGKVAGHTATQRGERAAHCRSLACGARLCLLTSCAGGGRLGDDSSHAALAHLRHAQVHLSYARIIGPQRRPSIRALLHCVAGDGRGWRAGGHVAAQVGHALAHAEQHVVEALVGRSNGGGRGCGVVAAHHLLLLLELRGGQLVGECGGWLWHLEGLHVLLCGVELSCWGGCCADAVLLGVEGLRVVGGRLRSEVGPSSHQLVGQTLIQQRTVARTSRCKQTERASLSEYEQHSADAVVPPCLPY